MPGDAAEIDEVFGREIAALLSRAYSDKRHLDSYTSEERLRWGALAAPKQREEPEAPLKIELTSAPAPPW